MTDLFVSFAPRGQMCYACSLALKASPAIVQSHPCRASFPPFSVFVPGVIRLATLTCHPPDPSPPEHPCYAVLVLCA